MTGVSSTGVSSTAIVVIAPIRSSMFSSFAARWNNAFGRDFVQYAAAVRRAVRQEGIAFGAGNCGEHQTTGFSLKPLRNSLKSFAFTRLP
jgi:hypothetical protein